jgi:hypothetical protein
MTDIASAGHAPAGRIRRYRRFLGAGAGSGLLGSICCVGSAIAVGTGIGGLSFLTTWMSRYQIYFIAASIAIMAAWLTRVIRRSAAGQGVKAAARQISRQALTMAAVYAVTLLAGMAAAGFAGRG